MPKIISSFLKVIFLAVCLIFIIWSFQEFLKAGSVYSLYGWCYLLLGTVSPAIVLLGHSEKRKKGEFLSDRFRLWLEGAVLLGLIILAIGFFVPAGFIPQLVLCIIGFIMAIPTSFVYLYLLPSKPSSR